TTQPLRSGPITGPSSLLRAAPPLHSASVLSPSRLEPLAASPFTPSAWQSTGSHVPYESLVELRAAYMPDATRAVSGIPRANPGGRVTPRFWHRLNRFRHFCGGSLSLASLHPARWGLVPAVPPRSPPPLLSAAACGGLRSAPDRRTRRALLHLSYSCAPPILASALVTHDPKRSLAVQFCCDAQRCPLVILAPRRAAIGREGGTVPLGEARLGRIGFDGWFHRSQAAA